MDSIRHNVDDSLQDVTKLLGVLSHCQALPPAHPWQVDLRGCKYLGPWAAALLYGTYCYAKSRRQKVRIRLPKDPPELRAFCAFSGMSQHFSGGDAPDPDHPSSETVPLEQFKVADWATGQRIVRLLHRHTHLGPDEEDRIRTCVQEVVQNVVDHSDSPIGGVMSARYLSKSNEVRVGIVDCGVGIRQSLSSRHSDIFDDEIALTRVVHGGFSSLSRPNNMGLGISNLFLLVKNSGGRIMVATGGACVESHEGMEPKVQSLNCRIVGTSVFFALRAS